MILLRLLVNQIELVKKLRGQQPKAGIGILIPFQQPHSIRGDIQKPQRQVKHHEGNIQNFRNIFAQGVRSNPLYQPVFQCVTERAVSSENIQHGI